MIEMMELDSDPPDKSSQVESSQGRPSRDKSSQVMADESCDVEAALALGLLMTAVASAGKRRVPSAKV